MARKNRKPLSPSARQNAHAPDYKTHGRHRLAQAIGLTPKDDVRSKRKMSPPRTPIRAYQALVAAITGPRSVGPRFSPA